MRRWLELTIALSCLAPPAALAWDGNELWNAPTTGPTSGGAGIWGTGSRRDGRITCEACHEPPATGGMPVDLTLAFQPALEQVGGAPGYRPGRRYTVTATLTGETLGLSGCGQYLTHTNGFGVSFEDGSGLLAGRLESDLGMNASSCPPTVPQLATDSTITYGDCHALVSSATPNRSTWTFVWTAPPAGSGTVTLYWGVVDGDCDMTSRSDQAKTGSRALAEGSASRAGERRSRWALLVGLLLPVLALVLSRRRRGAI
ncbi:MAG: hypothetical protein IT380_27805 [Myxococcales bacterium]|nr:hypothetical protein [Myxococcales bacterium]